MRFRSSYAVMFLSLLTVGIYSIKFGEKVWFNNGLGWDGKIYGELTKNFQLRNLDPYYVPRILPSAVIHYTLKGIGVPFSDENIVKAFGVYNLFLILASCLIWLLIANELKISLKGKWLGFIALFINFPILKMAFYYTVLTDVTAFTIGLLLAYFFLRKSVWGMFLATIAGAFTWPTIAYAGILLFLFAPKSIEETEKKNTAFGLISSIGFTALYLLLVIYFYFIRGLRSPNPASMILQPVLESVVSLSILTSVAYCFFAIKGLTERVTFSSFFVSLKVTPLCLLLSAPIIVILLAQPSLTDFHPPSERTQNFLKIVGLLSIARPFMIIFSHIIYYPIVMLLVFLWKPFCREAKSHGPGMMLFVTFSLIISLSPESRQSLSAFPVFAVLLVKITERLHWKRHVYWTLGLIALVFSKVWLPINKPQSTEPINVQMERYFMSQSPWMLPRWYLIQMLFVASAMALVAYLRRARHHRSYPEAPAIIAITPLT